MIDITDDILPPEPTEATPEVKLPSGRVDPFAPGTITPGTHYPDADKDDADGGTAGTMDNKVQDDLAR